ncbi:anoctamin-4-like [Dendronephthya gigantea]|uniref:anoctamin-4-like n=1 Tax=Dendronephthya gigantea TaxID=151771 RepID=UPI00106B3F8B|nr:anoctamin-4-like [Dendronephthya gigantea]
MAYPPPQGNFSYQRAYPPDYEQNPYPPPIGFQNYIAANPGAPPTQNQPYPPPTTVAYHGAPEPRTLNEPRPTARNDVPEVGFEGFSRRSNPPSAQSASGVELENVEDLPHDIHTKEPEEQLSDSSATRIELENQPKPLYFRDGRRKIDYILAYQDYPDKPMEWQEKRKDKREHFEANLKEYGLELEQEDFDASKDGKTVYIKIHAPWEVLACVAEEMSMRMPTKRNDLETKGLIDKIFSRFGGRSPFEISSEDVPKEENYFTCAFQRDRLENFKGHENKETFFSSSQRSLIVYRILKSTAYDEDKSKIGVDRLVSNLSYNAAYPLHEGYHKPSSNSSERTERQILYDVWGKFKRFYKKQPLNLIRKYFGEKIGIYFAWLGFYTILLFPAAVVGVINVIYGLARLGDYTPTNIICNETLKDRYVMCPRCDKKCDYFPLYHTCGYSRAAYVFDNEFTVIFAIFMSLWSTMFLEFWKRRQVEIAYNWDLLGFEVEEESIRPEYEVVCTEKRNNPITQVQEPYYPSTLKCPRFVCSSASVFLMICLVVLAVFGVIVYRVSVFAALTAAYDSNIGSISLSVTASAAVINLIIILLLSFVYEKLAYILTDMELPRTQSKYEDSFTIKMYLFQFVNYYSSLFYIAFAKLNPGRPGDYHRIFGFRQEECNAAGCLVELTIQLAIIMVGKQVFNAAMELFIPKILNWWKRRGNIIKKFRGEEVEDSSGPVSRLRWENDYYLTEIPRNALFYEYLEMVIQFGFITIFVAAFPLGPLFALLNNLVEIRLDAYKFVTTYRRPRAARAEDIGIWYSILKGVVICSVLVNGFIIAFVSEFIPRLYFQWSKGKDGSLRQYLETSLSCYDTRDYPDSERPNVTLPAPNTCGLGLPSCRYRGYRDKPMSLAENPSGNLTNNYDFTKDYWHILSAQLFFVIAFLIVVFGLTFILAYIIPDKPKKLDNQIRREAYLAKSILRTDQVPVDN